MFSCPRGLRRAVLPAATKYIPDTDARGTRLKVARSHLSSAIHAANTHALFLDGLRAKKMNKENETGGRIVPARRRDDLSYFFFFKHPTPRRRCTQRTQRRRCSIIYPGIDGNTRAENVGAFFTRWMRARARTSEREERGSFIDRADAREEEAARSPLWLNLKQFLPPRSDGHLRHLKYS